MFSISLIAIIVLALAFDFINGFHDTANSIATSVSTRVLSPKAAIIMAAGLNLFGALISSKVAKTISSGLVDGNRIGNSVIIAALISAIIWNLITWYFGIPSSSSHALIGGLVGASIAYAWSSDIVIWSGIFKKVILPLIASPIAGFVFGYLFMNIIFELLRKSSQSFVNRWFSKLQILSAAWMAFSHGKNDAQKSMGIITLALISSGALAAGSDVPTYVKIACALVMAFGTSIGGWKIIKTMGVNMIRLQPVNGFAAETGAAMVIEAASYLGAPVSTTHVISSSIMGVGASKRFSAVRWALAKNIVWAWVLTIPVTAGIGALITLAIKIFS